MTDACDWDEGDGGDWKHEIADLVSLTGSEWREAIIQITGSSLPPMDWQQAICDKVGTGRDPIDWAQALNDYAVAHSLIADASDEDWKLLIVQIMTIWKG